jgi:serine/threonine protein kinase
VYGATYLHTGRKFALKFFGYTSRKPIDADIQREIDFMVKLTGVKGVVQIEGVFMDDPIQHPSVGDNKEWKIRYPVIVMEVLNGGALYDRVQRHKFMSEQILKQVFRGFVEGLMGIHKLNLLHRDLKLDNIMLQSLDDDNQAVKIIDFGMMVYLPPGEKKYVASKISGTRGYLAPESIEHKEYSVLSDIWQVGVVLYNILSGAAPFHAENLEQTVKGKYYPMVGPEWDKISDNAKDLVKRLLVVKPDWRLSLAQILKHKWMTTKAPNVDLGADYARRIKALALRTKMKNFFQWNPAMMQQSRIKQEHLREMLPFLKNKKKPALQPITEGEDGTRKVEPTSGLSVEGGEFGSPVKIVRRSTISSETIQVATDLSMRTFKLRLHDVRDLSSSSSVPAGDNHAEGGEDGEAGMEIAAVAEADAVEINYERFVDILTRAKLPDLATPNVFNLFDIGNKGIGSIMSF